MTTVAQAHSARLADLLRAERRALAEFLLALADFDERKRWLELGYATLFDYLQRDLGLSKGAAFYRLTAARLVQRHPAVVEPLRDGRLCFSSVVQLSKVLTSENEAEVLPRYFHLSKREAKAVTAELRPAASVPTREVVTAVLAAPGAPRLSLTTWALPAMQAHEIPAESAASASPTGVGEGAAALPLGAVEPPRRAVVHPGEPPTAAPGAGAPPAPGPPPVAEEPLTAELTRLHITVPRRLLRKLEQAREALSHSHPGASADLVIEAGLDLLLERHAKRRGLVAAPRVRAAASRKSGTGGAPKGRAGAVVAPKGEATRRAEGGRSGRPSPRRSRDRIPASVLRDVWTRDGGRCQWKLPSGQTCGSTHRVQVDHVVPIARGGGSTADDLRLLCDVHNDVAAREALGDAWMDRFTRRGRERGSG